MAPDSRSYGSTSAGFRPHLLQRLNRVLSEHVRRSLEQAAVPGAQGGGSPALLDAGLDLAPLDPRLLRLCARLPSHASALVINSFANWRGSPKGLQLAGVAGFRELHFNTRLPTGVRGTPPVMSLLAMGDGTVAVTAQAMDYLATSHGNLALAYRDLVLPASLGPWSTLMLSLRQDPLQFHHVDVAALVKGALGLSRIFPERPIQLLYLFLEPVNPERYAAFAAHRAELHDLVERTRGGLITLHAQSFAELWSEWDGRDEPPWLRDIVARLRARYLVAAPR